MSLFLKSRRRGLVALLLMATLTAACSGDPIEEARQFVKSGDEFVAQKNYEAATIQYRNAVAKDPRSGDARLKLGKAYAESGNGLAALREYVRAADLMPQNLDAQLAAGAGLYAAGQYPEAKARAQAALAVDPKSVEGLLLLGNSTAGLKDIDAAVAQVEDAIEADPKRVLSYANLGALQLAKGDREAAESALRRAIEIDPKSTAGHLGLANFYWAGGQLEDAEKAFAAAHAADPTSAQVNRAVAAFYSLTGRADRSEPYLKAYADASTEPGPKLVLADYYVMNRRQDEGLAILKALADTKDGKTVAQQRLAAIDYAAGRKTEAYAALDAILKTDKHVPTMIEKARLLLNDGRASEALELATSAAKLDPRSAGAHFALGSAHRVLGDLPAALQSFQEVLRLAPSSTSAMLAMAEVNIARGAPQAAIEFTTQAIKQSPRLGAAHMMRAQALLRSGDISGAEREAAGLEAGSKGVPEVHSLMGDVQMAKGDRARARQSYERALALRPTSLDPLNGLVRLDLAEGKVASAVARVDAGLSRDPKNEPMLMLAARTLSTAGDVTRAEKVYRQVIEVNPSNAQAYHSLGVLYLSQRRLDDAKREYTELVKNPRTEVAANTMLATILSMQGQHDEAKKIYERVLALNPDVTIASNNLAWYYADRGENLDVALKLAQTAKAKSPDLATVSDTLGWVYYKKGLFGLAVTSFEQAAAQDKADPSIRYRLGLAYLGNGDRQKARQSLEQALKMSDRFKEAEEARKALATLQG